MRRIILISCVKAKVGYPTEAENLYTSTLFKFSLKYAQDQNPDRIFILSAKHGLLCLHTRIAPYEETLNTMKDKEVKQWSGRVIKQLSKVSCIDQTKFIFLAGLKYRKYLVPHMKNVQIPLEGLRIGEQLQMLKGSQVVSPRGFFK